MPSRKELILYNYTILEKALHKYISKDIFPNLEDNDITDIVYFITISFLDGIFSIIYNRIGFYIIFYNS